NVGIGLEHRPQQVGVAQGGARARGTGQVVEATDGVAGDGTVRRDGCRDVRRLAIVRSSRALSGVACRSFGLFGNGNAGFDDEVLRATGHDDVFDIVATDDHHLALAVDGRALDDHEPLLDATEL